MKALIILVGGGLAFAIYLANYSSDSSPSSPVDCKGMMSWALDDINKEEEGKNKALKVYDDIEDVTTDEVAVKGFKEIAELDLNAKILLLCKGRIMFSKGPKRAIVVYKYEDVDGDGFRAWMTVPL